MSTNITALSSMSQTSTNKRTNEEILVTLLIIAILAIGSLFAVAQTVGNRLLGFKPKVHRAGKSDQKSKVNEMPHDLNAARADASANPTIYLREEDGEPNAKLQSLQPQNPIPQIHLPAPLHDRARNHAAGLGVIQDWEVSTIDRIRRQKARKLDRLPSLDHGQKTQDIYDILAWEESTMRRFQQEKMRRLERLSLVDRQEVAGAEEKAGEAVRAWENAAKRDVEREKGLKSVGQWELSQEEKRSRIGKEKRAIVEDDRRTVLWKAGLD